VSRGPVETAKLPARDQSGSPAPDPTGNNILYVIGSLDVGGTERHLALLAPRLRRFGWNSAIYCLTQPGRVANQVAKTGVQILPPPLTFAPKQGWFLVRSLKMILSALKLFWIMVRTRPQVAHFFLPASYLIGAPLSLAAGVPIRVMSRRSLNRYQGRHPLLSRCERWLHRRMTAILGNSQHVVRELIDEEGCPPERVALIYNGIDVSAFAATRAPTDMRVHKGERPLVLITVANLIPYKGHSDLVAALGGVAHALPKQWSLVCVGQDYGIGARLKQQARALGIGENIELLGTRSDIAELLAAADIGVLASHEEGFANSILEGMAARLPMIVTDVGGNAEAVVDGVTGLVVPSRDGNAFGAAILKLALDPELRRTMGDAGRQRVETYFGIDRCVTNYARLYVGLMRGERLADIAGFGTPR
jgi:glycosyltransferase involved in cell wall biosynthesis